MNRIEQYCVETGYIPQDPSQVGVRKAVLPSIVAGTPITISGLKKQEATAGGEKCFELRARPDTHGFVARYDDKIGEVEITPRQALALAVTVDENGNIQGMDRYVEAIQAADQAKSTEMLPNTDYFPGK